MNDLIWVGNSLYPRWFAFGAVFLAAAGVFYLAGIIKEIVKLIVARKRS